MPTYQFARISGYPRGSASARGTMSSVLREGIRAETHSGHVDAPDIRIQCHRPDNLAVQDYEAWIEEKMASCATPFNRNGKEGKRKLRPEAIAIGTIIASLPSPTRDTDPRIIESFREDVNAWAKEYLESRRMRLDYTITHLDEEYPHIHLWFTPCKEDTDNKLWSMSWVTKPPRPDLYEFGNSFFNEVGYKYYDRKAKPEEEQVKRINNRARAVQNRLPPGQSERTTGHPDPGMLGQKQGDPDKQMEAARRWREIQESEEFREAIKRIVMAMYNRRSQALTWKPEVLAGLLAQDAAIDPDIAAAIQSEVTSEHQRSNHPGQQYEGAGNVENPQGQTTKDNIRALKRRGRPI
ncbi:MAG: hypothetical protein ACQEXG_11075 [Pseudomonadota bacterium]